MSGKKFPETNSPFKIKVYRGDFAPGKGSRVSSGFVVLAYLDIQDDTAAHEFGHMLGLGDEYELPGESAEAAHSQLVEKSSVTRCRECPRAARTSFGKASCTHPRKAKFYQSTA